MSGEGLRERPEPPIGVDIVNDKGTARLQDHPGSIQLETYVAFTVKAVMNEEIDLPKSQKQRGKAPPA
jgi:hypothetical protein